MNTEIKCFIFTQKTLANSHITANQLINTSANQLIHTLANQLIKTSAN
jgi:hypothetical protein